MAPPSFSLAHFGTSALLKVCKCNCLRDRLNSVKYRVSQQVSDLGWIDFDVDVLLIVPSCFAHSA